MGQVLRKLHFRTSKDKRRKPGKQISLSQVYTDLQYEERQRRPNLGLSTELYRQDSREFNDNHVMYSHRRIHPRSAETYTRYVPAKTHQPYQSEYEYCTTLPEYHQDSYLQRRYRTLSSQPVDRSRHDRGENITLRYGHAGNNVKPSSKTYGYSTYGQTPYTERGYTLRYKANGQSQYVPRSTEQRSHRKYQKYDQKAANTARSQSSYRGLMHDEQQATHPTQWEKPKLTKDYEPKKFLDQVPPRDTAGNELPVWKRHIVARQIAEKAQRENEEKQMQDDEDRRWRNVPDWKKAILQKRDADLQL